MRITILGHASVVVEAAGRRVVVDPMLCDSFASGAIGWHPARSIDPDALGPVDAVVVTHGHLDHFDPASVARIRRRPGAPLVVPDDAWLVSQCERHGLGGHHVLAPWARLDLGGLVLVATPSTFEVEELGIAFSAAEGRYWHMSDALVDRSVGARVVEEVGPVDVVAARYQPGNVLVGYQRNAGASYDERAAVVEWLEAACAAQPRFVFPYFWGVAHRAEHAWANRYQAPFRADEVARLLGRRLAGSASTAVVAPGDVVEVAGPGGPVRHLAAAAGFVTARPGDPVDAWEPVDLTTLAGVAPGDRAALARAFQGWLASVCLPWLQEQLAAPGSPLRRLVDWGAVWQVVVHAGDGERIVYSADFRDGPGTVRDRAHPDANYVAHLSGRALWQVLTGQAGADLFWMSGAARFHEKLLTVRDAQVWAPPVSGFALWEQVPEPVTYCLRRFGRGGVTVPAP